MRATPGRAATARRVIAREESRRIDIICPRRPRVAAKGKRRVNLETAAVVTDRAMRAQALAAPAAAVAYLWPIRQRD